MDLTLALVIATVAIALFFDYTNGFHDAANAIATSVSTRALTPRKALPVHGGNRQLHRSLISAETWPPRSGAAWFTSPPHPPVYRASPLCSPACSLGDSAGQPDDVAAWVFLHRPRTHSLGGSSGPRWGAPPIWNRGCEVHWAGIAREGDRAHGRLAASGLHGRWGTHGPPIMWIFRRGHPGFRLNRMFRLFADRLRCRDVPGPRNAGCGEDDGHHRAGPDRRRYEHTGDDIPLWVIVAAASAISLGTMLRRHGASCARWAAASSPSTRRAGFAAEVDRRDRPVRHGDRRCTLRSRRRTP